MGKSNHFCSPCNESLYKCQLNDPLANLHTFGCRVFVYNEDANRKKLNARALEGMFIRYAEHQKGWIVWIPYEQKLRVSRNLKFIEEPKKNTIAIETASDHQPEERVEVWTVPSIKVQAPPKPPAKYSLPPRRELLPPETQLTPQVQTLPPTALPPSPQKNATPRTIVEAAKTPEKAIINVDDLPETLPPRTPDRPIQTTIENFLAPATTTKQAPTKKTS